MPYSPNSFQSADYNGTLIRDTDWQPDRMPVTYPLYLGELPYPVKLVPAGTKRASRTIDIRHPDGRAEHIVFDMEEDETPEGITQKQGEPCYVVRNKKLWWVKWPIHGCKAPERDTPMTEDAWEDILKGFPDLLD